MGFDLLPSLNLSTNKQYLRNEVTMKSFLAILSLIPAITLAETGTFTVEGMTCTGCKKMVTKHVCDNPELNKNFESCEVTLVDTKKKLGQVVIVSKKDAKISVDTVKNNVTAAGSEYKVIKEEVK